MGGGDASDFNAVRTLMAQEMLPERHRMGFLCAPSGKQVQTFVSTESRKVPMPGSRRSEIN